MSNVQQSSAPIITPYQKEDFHAVHGMFVGSQHLKTAHDDLERYLHLRDMSHSFVAKDENGHVVGFIIAEQHGKQIDMITLYSDDRLKDGDLCKSRLVTRLAQHCADQAHDKMGILVSNKNPDVMNLFNHVGHQVTKTGKAPDGTNLEVYTVDPRKLLILAR